MADERVDQSAREGPSEQATRPPGTQPKSGWRPFLSPERLGETSSTNAELIERASSGAPEGTVVLADRQSAGRGRLGRQWLDHPGGSVLCSILFRPGWPIGCWFLGGWLVALAAIDACRQVAGVDARCKWPNDLLAGAEHRKLAGVLAETTPPDGLVVGIGINCNWPYDFPRAGVPEAAEVAARAISLDRLAGESIDRDEVAAALLAAVATRWSTLSGPDGSLLAPGEAKLRAEYRRVCSTIGQEVRVELPGEVLTGRAVDVDEGGHLVVEIGSRLRAFDAADVVHLRPGDPATSR